MMQISKPLSIKQSRIILSTMGSLNTVWIYKTCKITICRNAYLLQNTKSFVERILCGNNAVISNKINNIIISISYRNITFLIIILYDKNQNSECDTNLAKTKILLWYCIAPSHILNLYVLFLTTAQGVLCYKK